MKHRGLKEVQEVLKNNPSCYILIACGQPSEDGQMQVKMTYSGELALVSYLIRDAQCFLDEEEEDLSDEETALESLRLIK